MSVLRLPLLLISIAVLNFHCGETTSDDTLKNLIEDAEYKRAAEYILSTPDQKFDDADLITVARVFNERTEFETSLPILQKIASDYPDNLPGNLLLANNLREQTDYNEALLIYNKLAEVDSMKFVILAERARLFTQLHEFEKARADINEAKALQPKYFATFLADGLLMYSQGDLEAALDLFEIAEELDPGVSGEASLYAGYVLLTSKINLDAMRKFTEAIENGRNINKGYAYINRGVCQFNLTDTAYACNDWDSAMAYLPEQAKTYLDQYCQGIEGKGVGKWKKQ